MKWPIWLTKTCNGLDWILKYTSDYTVSLKLAIFTNFESTITNTGKALWALQSRCHVFANTLSKNGILLLIQPIISLHPLYGAPASQLLHAGAKPMSIIMMLQKILTQ